MSSKSTIVTIRKGSAGTTTGTGSSKDNLDTFLIKASDLASEVTRRSVVLEYDFTNDGAVASGSAFSMRNVSTGITFNFPTNAQIIEGVYRVLTTFTSSSDAATISLGIPTDDAAGTVAAIAISDGTNPWDATAKFVTTIQTGAHSAASEVTTAARAFALTVGGGQDLTAGRIRVFLDYLVTSDT